jgi:predicted MFS family arabinose efflux permease
VLFVLSLAYILNFVDRQVLALVLEDVKTDLSLTDAQLGWLLGPTFAVFYTIAAFPLARWADSWSRRGVLAGSLAVWSGMTAVCGLATSFVQMAIARCLVAIGEAGGTPPSHSLISDYFSPTRRATALSIYGWGIFLGTALGFIGGGLIADRFDWRTAFVVAGALGIPIALLIVVTVQEPPPGASEGRVDEARPGTGEVLRALVGTPSFVTLMLAAACQAFLGYTVLGWGATFLRRVFDLSASEAGFQFGAAAGVAGAIGITAGGVLADRLAPRDARWYGWIAAISSAAAFPFALAFAWAESAAFAMPMFFVFYLLNNVYVSILWTLVQTLVVPRMRATASAAQLAILNIVGLGGGPLMAGYVSDVLEPSRGPDGLRVALVVAAVVGATAALFFALCARTLPRDLARVGAA